MTNRDRSTFEECILAGGLLMEQQLDEAFAIVRKSLLASAGPDAWPTDQQLADQLQKMGLLNAWQIKQLRNGRTKFNLAHYRIIDSIGQGGMGHVFKAVDTKMGRVVAVKVLPRYKSTPEAVISFAREVSAAGRLQHPRLVTALDAGHDGNVHYLVTEFVPGMDLRKRVRRDGPMNMAAAASIISQVAEGLQYAHDQGIVHRDVKPGNVLVTPLGEAKLSDLGLAESLHSGTKNDPRQAKIVGTADYLSPDQVFSPGCPTPGWDIYSLGCTLYYAVTGKVPFPGGTTADKARAHCDLRPLDPRRLNPGLSDEFVDVVADMMAKDPSQRIPLAREVIRRLAPFILGQPTFPASETLTQSAGPPRAATPPTNGRTIPLATRLEPPTPIRAAHPLPTAMGWATADTKTDLSLLSNGSNDDGGLVETEGIFDLEFLDEEVVASIDTPVRRHDAQPRANWRKRAAIVGGIVGTVIILRWLVNIAQTFWPTGS